MMRLVQCVNSEEKAKSGLASHRRHPRKKVEGVFSWIMVSSVGERGNEK